MRSILKSTNQYEDWLRGQTDLQEKRLLKKHAQMAVGAFPFLRATFYRWAELWPELCPELRFIREVKAKHP